MIRRGEPRDEASLVRLRAALWPDEKPGEGRAAARALLAGEPPGVLPTIVVVAEVSGSVVGFAEVSLRSYVDGCAQDRPAGYLEGWYVDPEHRGTGVGRALVEAAEAWCRAQGCREMGSDTWLDNEASQLAHRALGFEVVDRCVNFRKALAPGPRARDDAFYGADLAALHHAHFGDMARSAAAVLVARLAAAGLDGGRVVDLATGSGILSRRVVDAGCRAVGVDLSAAMLRLARRLVPEATLVAGSLWDVPLPADSATVAVAAVGEALSYAADPAAGLARLRARLIDIRRALAPGGLLLFDVAGPGRGGPGGSRERSFRHGGSVLRLEEREDAAHGLLLRRLIHFLPFGRLYRRVDETHRLKLYEPGSIEALLTDTGFAWERLHRYRETDFPPGLHGFLARRDRR